MDQDSILDDSILEDSISVPPRETARAAGTGTAAAVDVAEQGTRAREQLHFPAEDEGRSLAEMAQRDLDAALHLLAERAQYITEASGAAIALRQGVDMVCRASAGENAPELGAYLSAESGLSGESVRTRQVLRCDDAESDPRVNRESCRELGIASVVVAPIVREKEVLGVFELFSGKAFAFGERDLSAVQRLGEMVEIAVEHAEAAQTVAAEAEVIAIDGGAEAKEPASAEPAAASTGGDVLAGAEESRPGPGDVAGVEAAEAGRGGTDLVASLARKGVLWSAPEGSGNEVEKQGTAEKAASRSFALQSCQACGIPVSKGRRLCVLCEEKKWRGEPLGTRPGAKKQDSNTAATPGPTAEGPMRTLTGSTSATGGATVAGCADGSTRLELANTKPEQAPVDPPQFLSGGGGRSWLAANKYVIGAMLLVAAVALTILRMR